MMRIIALVFSLTVCVAAMGQEPATPEEKAVSAILKLGGTVARDEKLPGRPVIRVDLHGPKVTDSDLKDLKELKGLRKLWLNDTQIMIPALVRQIIRGLTKVAELGFSKAVIATDHGFVLFHEQGAGNVAPRPSGNWLIEKTRCMLGQGTADSANMVMKRGELGIPGDFKDFAAPKTLVPYSRGQIYYHEGLSLQECVLPCLTVRLEVADKKVKKSALPRLTLTYRQGKSDRITMLRPVVDLAWPQGSLISEESEIEVTIEAVDSKGNIVGWVGAGQSVNPATGGVRIQPGAALAVGLSMEADFSGNFTVRVLDPATNVLLAELKLKTGYLE